MSLRCPKPGWKQSLIFLAIAVLSQTSSEVQSGPHSIQLGTYSTRSEAESAAETFGGEFSPILLHEDANTTASIQLLAGEFDSYAAAWAYRHALRAGAAPNSLIVDLPESGVRRVSPALIAARSVGGRSVARSVTKSADNETTVTFPFAADVLQVTIPADDPRTVVDLLVEAGVRAPGASAKAVAARANSPSDADLTAEARSLRDALALTESADRIVALEQHLATYGSGPSRGRARLNLAKQFFNTRDYVRLEAMLAQEEPAFDASQKSIARMYRSYLKLERDGKEVATLQDFKDLAADKQIAAPIRWDALRRVAGIQHGRKNFAESWLAFEQLQNSAPDPAARAEARLELAGLSMELAGADKGTYADAEGMLNQLLQMPGIPTKMRATASLMHLETVSYRGDTAAALQEAKALQVNFPNERREFLAALHYEGVLQCRLYNLEAAQPVLERVLAWEYQRGDRFAGRELRATAALWLAWLHEQKNEPELHQKYLVILREQFHDTTEYKQAQKLFGSRLDAVVPANMAEPILTNQQ